MPSKDPEIPIQIINVNNFQYWTQIISSYRMREDGGMWGDGLRLIIFIRLLIPLIAAGLLLFLILLPVRISVVYEGRGPEWRLRLTLGIFKDRLSLKTSFPPPRKSPRRGPVLARRRTARRYGLRLGKSGVGTLAQWRRARRAMAGIARVIGAFKELLRRSVCTRLLWETGFGAKDYAATGVTAGLLWAGKGLLLGFLSRNLRIDPAGVRIVVVPRFGSACYESTLDCILETSLGHIILVVFKLGIIWLIQSPGIFARRRRYA